MPPVAWDNRPMAPRELEELVTVMLVPACAVSLAS